MGGSCPHKAISAIAENGTQAYYYVLFSLFCSASLYNLSTPTISSPLGFFLFFFFFSLSFYCFKLLRQCAIPSLPLLLLPGFQMSSSP
ncbi:hypothetical protein VNO80_04222 [Phaseolus coccineus]|uniref:Uncharacterized protein n=1 Tax=Phaseolus coccineus TaxID=3886 RepID=A0AAN9NUI0_PHACN